MQEQPILRINEIFWSFQGEGSRAGVPSIFIRLAGCSLKCFYCDQKDAWSQGIEMSIQEILQRVLSLKEIAPQSQIVLTGGEPQEQDLSTLITALKNEGFFIAIETNGSLFSPLSLDWWTVSPKDVNEFYLHPELIPHIDEIKLIVNNSLDTEVIKNLRAIAPKPLIYLQPDGYDSDGYRNTYDLFIRCQAENIQQLRCGIQLHTIYQVQ